MSEVFRQFRIEPQMFAGDRVHKAQRFGVQALAVQAGDAIVRAIHRVARHRVLDGCHVHADLMGAAGLQAAFQHGKVVQPFQHLIAGIGIFGVAG